MYVWEVSAPPGLMTCSIGHLSSWLLLLMGQNCGEEEMEKIDLATHTLPEDRKIKEDSCALMKSVNVSINVCEYVFRVCS